MPNFSWAKPYSNKGRPKFFRLAELIQRPILTAAEQSSKGENGQTAYKIFDLDAKLFLYLIQCMQENHILYSGTYIVPFSAK